MLVLRLSKYKHLSIKNKLLATYIILIILITLLFMSINSYLVIRENEKQVLYSANQILNQTKSYLDSHTQTIRNVMNYVSLSEVVQQQLVTDSLVYSRDLFEWQKDEKKLLSVLRLALNTEEIDQVSLYMKDGLAKIKETEYLLKLTDKETGSMWYDRLLHSSSLCEWFPSDVFSGNGDDYIYAVRIIREIENISNCIGVLKVSIPYKYYSKILGQSLITYGTCSALVNEYNEMICNTNPAFFQSIPDLYDIIGNYSRVNGSKMWHTVNINGEKYLYAIKTVYSGWYLVTFIPYRDIKHLNMETQSQFLLVSAIIALLTLPLAFFVSRESTKIIKELTLQTKKVTQRNFDATIDISNTIHENDEIGDLIHSYNFMISKINSLMREMYELGRENKNLELKSLQAQINPHFLYNTLDLIVWKARKYKAFDIAELVKLISNFYKLSLGRGSEMVTIRNEIEHVKTYVKIQNMRFNNNLRLISRISEDILDVKVPKLILQPIIENSILHGIMEKEEEKGSITVTNSVENDNIYIYVKDDGVGIPEEKLAEISAELNKTDSIMDNNKSHGYGIINVDRRLKLKYGQEYGLSYESKINEGTIVTLKLRILK